MKVEFGTKALKFLSKLEKDDKERVFKRIKELGEDPFPSNVKKLKYERDGFTGLELEISGFFIMSFEKMKRS